MPRYYFNLEMSGTAYPDPEGREVRDLQHARDAAIADTRDLIAADAKAGQLCLSCNIDIADERGRIVLIVPFHEVVQVTGIEDFAPRGPGWCLH